MGYKLDKVAVKIKLLFASLMLVAAAIFAVTVMIYAFIGIYSAVNNYREYTPRKGAECVILPDSTKINADMVYTQLCRDSVLFPEIVTRQAILETGWFTSQVFESYNNLFGFMHGNSYWSYPTWKASIRHYKNWQLKNYRKGDYYEFLTRIGYAEEPTYIQRLKGIKWHTTTN